MTEVKKRVVSVGIISATLFAVLALCMLTLTNVVRASQYAISSDEIVDFTPMNQENEQVAYLTDGDFLPSSRTAYGQNSKGYYC